MSKSVLFILPLLLVGCATERPNPRLITTLQVPMLPVDVPGTVIAGEERESLRTGEKQKSYPYGRYQDPNDPNVMYDGGVLHRTEETAKWNLRPNAPQSLNLGPVTARRDDAAATNPYAAEMEQVFKQQQQYMAAIIEQNDATTKALATVQQKAAELDQTRQEQAHIKTQLDALAQDNRQLRQQLEEAQKPKLAPKSWWKFWD